jgi:NAD(P)-dependent dehydrogenase (short-subunit alcohol dehydrogenase family)
MPSTVALITGATHGLGTEVARQLAQRGATVLVSGRDAAKAAATAEQLRPAGDVRALPVALDVTGAASVAAVAAALRDDPGRLDVLINNAAAYVDWAETATGADLDAAQTLSRARSQPNSPTHRSS